MIATYKAAVTPQRDLFKVPELYRDNKIKSNGVSKGWLSNCSGDLPCEKDMKETLRCINL